MNISVIGVGHVGLVTAACLAKLGHRVIGVDQDKERIRLLKGGDIPFHEPGLEEMVRANLKEGKLSFTGDMKVGVRESEVIFIAVGTPSLPNGEPDLSFVEAVSRDVASHMDEYKVIVEKSTVPVMTGDWVKRVIERSLSKGIGFDVVSNPEFLREGSAVEDFLKPDRIVIGIESERAEGIMRRLYEPLKAPILVTDIKSAELIKHASNSFLALKISYINGIARICEKVGADVVEVARGMGLDHRIGSSYLQAGVGYGGFCLPKDVDAFIKLAEGVGYDFELLKACRMINISQRRWILEKLKESLWILKDKTIGILGLSFKPDTDDIRDSVSISIIDSLKKEGAKVKAFDPAAMENAKRVLKDVEYCSCPYEVSKGADALLILTEWKDFKDLDLKRVRREMKEPLLIDGRNLFDPKEMEKLRFTYISVGR